MTRLPTRAKAFGLCLVLIAPPAFAADVCHQIDARAGWQVAEFPPGLVQDIRSTGFWSVQPGLDPAGTQGHGGLDGKGLEDRRESRPHLEAFYGALLVRFEVAGAARTMDWARFHGAIRQAGTFNMNLGRIEFRINEGDAVLDDNTGVLTVCFRYAD
ncbi:hypothetical protein [Maliponia aquimaris]|uniref:Uncharacterized protein n=1 Tax=Maliponia aquimaris TaxID=1673631 RepID=A0A238KDM9_9RHOB|nr:hypothetical protein [Maliponia aquimaris]SMX40687.1 hypothetical protein MAA8898_02218 [Maliponia aquimaris]